MKVSRRRRRENALRVASNVGGTWEQAAALATVAKIQPWYELAREAERFAADVRDANHRTEASDRAAHVAELAAQAVRKIRDPRCERPTGKRCLRGPAAFPSHT
jgi:hypothetical protein